MAQVWQPNHDLGTDHAYVAFGLVVHEPERICHECVRIAFELTRRRESRRPAISRRATPHTGWAGHWDERLVCGEGHMRPEDAMLIGLLERVNR